MIRCNVEQLRYGPIQVRFPDHPGKELFFQTDWDQAAFACSCGLIPTDNPSSPEFAAADLTDIEECLNDYLEVATDIHPDDTY